MKFTVALLFLMCMSFTAIAQEPLYRVRIASMKQPFDATKFDHLKPYGQLSFEEADNGFTRVYLGNYIGKAAAKQVVALARKKGHKGAYSVVDNALPTDAAGNPLVATWQISASKALDIMFLYMYNQDILQQALISYVGGTYRISLGYYAEGDKVTEEAMKGFAAFMGVPNGFSRRVGASAKPAAKPKPAGEPTAKADNP